MKIIKLLQNGDAAAAPPHVRLANPNRTDSENRTSRDAVELQAYLLYVREGRPEGRDVHHWLKAEALTMPM